MTNSISKNPELFLIAVGIGLLCRWLVKVVNKKKNDEMYSRLENETPERVVHLWIITIAKYRILFAFNFLAQIIILMIVFVLVDSVAPALDYYILAGVLIYGVVITSLQWMKIIYFEHLSPEKQQASAAYYNQNIKKCVEAVLQDPGIIDYLKNKPKFVRDYVAKRLFAMVPIR